MTQKPTYEELEHRVKELEKESVERKRIEERLEHQKETLQALMNAPTETAILTDLEGTILAVNEIAAQRIGKSSEELIGLEIFDYLPRDMARSRKTKADEVVRTGTSVRFQDERAGRFYDNNIYPVLDAEGKVVALAVYARDVTENKQAKESLRDSEGKLKAMLQSIGDHMSMMDKDLNIIWANSIAKKLFGNDIIGKKCHEVYHRRKEPCEPYPCITLKAFMDGGIHEHDTQVMDKDGKILSFHCTANVALKDKEGKPKAVVEISRDVTEYKRAEGALRESEEKYRHLSEGTFHAVVWHEKGKIIEANEQYYELFGYKPEELAGKDAILLTATPDSVKFMREQISLGHLGPYEVVGIKKDGTEFPMEIRAKTMKYKGKMARMAAIIELTERKQAFEALKEQKEFSEKIIKTSRAIIVGLDKDHKIRIFNKGAETITGFKSKEVIGNDWFKIFLKPEIYDEMDKVWKDAWGTKFHSYVNPVRVKNGGEKIISWQTTGMYEDADEKKHMLISIGEDITERIQAEEEIKASLKEKEALLSEIHHRVKNNFEIISSLLDMSSMQTENREIQNLWGVARDRIHSMALIHAQLYQNDRFDQVNMERHTEELVTHLSHIYDANQKKVRTIIEASEIYLSVDQAIPCALVLNELIVNAFKHAFKKREEGTVHISINNSADNTIQISVKDDGSGISEGFDLSDATGLGLKLARHLVIGQLKGEMRFSIDNGTEFQIEFKKVQ